MKNFTRLAAVLAAASIAAPAFACGLMHETSAEAKTPAPATAQKDAKAEEQVQAQQQPQRPQSQQETAAVEKAAQPPAKKVAQN